MTKPRVIALLGSTASGKTAIAIRVAQRLGGEIISADSRQAYRGLEVGTAAPTPPERALVPHHGVGFLEPGERYGAGRFARLARAWIATIESRGAVPILAGGTAFFVRALTDPVFREPPLDAERRAMLQAWMGERPLGELRRWTDRLDRGLGWRLAVVDRQRAQRSLEVTLLTGRSLSWWHRRGAPEAPPVSARTWVLDVDREILRARIEARTIRLLDQGWTEEVERLATAGHGPGSAAMSSIGYGTVLSLVRGEISREEAVASIVRDTWSYARRQRTWLRHQVGPEARRVDAGQPAETIADRIIEDWKGV